MIEMKVKKLNVLIYFNSFNINQFNDHKVLLQIDFLKSGNKNKK